MGRWGDAAEKAQGASDYLKLQDGTETTIRVLTDPVVQNKTFQSDPDNPKTVFSWIVWDYANKSPKILSKSGAFAKRLDFISEKWGDEIPMKCDIVIETTGTQLNTKYEIAAVPTTIPLPPDWEAQVGSLDLNKLVPGHIPIADFMKQESTPKSFPKAAPAPAESSTPAPVDDRKAVDEVFDVNEEEHINLDDIPF